VVLIDGMNSVDLKDDMRSIIGLYTNQIQPNEVLRTIADRLRHCKDVVFAILPFWSFEIKGIKGTKMVNSKRARSVNDKPGSQ
jgi:hypothetical protein